MSELLDICRRMWPNRRFDETRYRSGETHLMLYPLPDKGEGSILVLPAESSPEERVPMVFDWLSGIGGRHGFGRIRVRPLGNPRKRMRMRSRAIVLFNWDPYPDAR